MSSSVELATAFHNSKRSAMLPTLSASGWYSNSEVHYVDSVTLRDSLKRIHDITIQESSSFTKTRRIPVLFFSLNYRHPILVDKYYTSKALSDMVLIVQNGQRNFPSRLSCNSQPTYLNLRNPLKSALASTAILAGGIIPSHITYSEAHQNAISEWLWSVGDHPFSHTSYGAEFNRIQIDIARRNMLIHALAESIETVNTCVQLLRKIHIDETNEVVSHMVPLNSLSIGFSSVITQWKISCAAVASLDFDKAMKHVRMADDLADDLFELVIDTENLMGAYQCLPHVTADEDTESQTMLVLPILFICFDVLLFALVFMCRSTKKSSKAKIN